MLRMLVSWPSVVVGNISRLGLCCSIARGLSDQQQCIHERCEETKETYLERVLANIALLMDNEYVCKRLEPNNEMAIALKLHLENTR